LRLIGIADVPRHAHIVARFPYELFQKDPVLYTALISDYFRRVNLISEMLSIQLHDVSLRNVSSFFGYLDQLRLESFVDELKRIGTNPSELRAYRSKLHAVGVAGPGFYSDHQAWGFEVRTLLQADRGEISERVLDSIQWGLAHNDFGLDENHFKQWLKKFVEEENTPVASAIKGLHYNAEESFLPSLFKKSPVANPARTQLVQELVEKKVFDSHLELKMLTHNWQSDPLLFQNIEAIARVKRTQAIALDQIGEKWKQGVLNTPEITRIMKNFLQESQLLELLLKSLPRKP
jgi:hypothetical protein